MCNNDLCSSMNLFEDKEDVKVISTRSFIYSMKDRSKFISDKEKIYELENIIVELSDNSTIKNINNLVSSIKYKKYLRDNKKAFALQRIRNVLDSYLLLGINYANYVSDCLNYTISNDEKYYTFSPRKTIEIFTFLCKDIFDYCLPLDISRFNSLIKLCFDYYCNENKFNPRYGLNFDNYLLVCNTSINIKELLSPYENLISMSNKPKTKEITVNIFSDINKYSIPNISKLDLDMSNLKHTLCELLKTYYPLKIITKLCNQLFYIVETADYERTKIFSDYNSFLLIDYPTYSKILKIIKDNLHFDSIRNLVMICYNGKDFIYVKNKISHISNIEEFLCKIDDLTCVF